MVGEFSIEVDGKPYNFQYMVNAKTKEVDMITMTRNGVKYRVEVDQKFLHEDKKMLHSTMVAIGCYWLVGYLNRSLAVKVI
jgi:hypothetical protein